MRARVRARVGQRQKGRESARARERASEREGARARASERAREIEKWGGLQGGHKIHVTSEDSSSRQALVDGSSRKESTCLEEKA